MGSIKPNEDAENESVEDSAKNDWMGLLDKNDETYSLKPWEEVMGANKVNLSLALREFVRKAWGEFCIISILLYPSQLDDLVNSGRRGRIPWGSISAQPHKLIDKKFILKPTLRNPTRMSLENVEAYWTAWALKASKGEPFSFHVWKGKEKATGDNNDGNEEEGEEGEEEEGGKDDEEGDGEGESESEVEGKGKVKGVKEKRRRGKEDTSEDEQEEEGRNPPEPGRAPIPPTADFDIDQGIPLPCQCVTHSVRTTCLQELFPKLGDSGKAFHNLVGLVDTLEVSPVLLISFLLHLMAF